MPNPRAFIVEAGRFYASELRWAASGCVPAMGHQPLHHAPETSMEMPTRPWEVLGLERAGWCRIKITPLLHGAEGQESRKKVRGCFQG